jgi:hypothetical protein
MAVASVAVRIAEAAIFVIMVVNAIDVHNAMAAPAFVSIGVDAVNVENVKGRASVSIVDSEASASNATGPVYVNTVSRAAIVETVMDLPYVSTIANVVSAKNVVDLAYVSTIASAISVGNVEERVGCAQVKHVVYIALANALVVF